MRALLVLVALLASVIGGGCASTDEDETLEVSIYLQNAQGYVDGGRYDEALNQFRRALAVDPGNSKALLGEAFALLYLGQGQGDTAAARIQEADRAFAGLEPERYDENSWKVNLGRGMVNARLAELYSNAAEMRNGAAAGGDTIASTERDHARAEVARRDAAAEREFTAVLARTDQPLARDNLAALFYLARHHALRATDNAGYDRALEFFRRYAVQVERSKALWRNSIKSDAANAPLYESRLQGAERQEVALRDLVANIHFKRRDHAASMEELNRILAIEPENSRAYLNRARNEEELGRYGEAADDYRRFLALTDDPPTTSAVITATERMRECEEKLGIR